MIQGGCKAPEVVFEEIFLQCSKYLTLAENSQFQRLAQLRQQVAADMDEIADAGRA
jgi:hypothetical protein